jgi:hypothetical protein
VLLATVGLRSGRTIYEELGDLWVLVLAAVALAVGWGGTAFGTRRSRGVTTAR